MLILPFGMFQKEFVDPDPVLYAGSKGRPWLKNIKIKHKNVRKNLSDRGKFMLVILVHFESLMKQLDMDLQPHTVVALLYA